MCVSLWPHLPPFLFRPDLPRLLPLLCPAAPWPAHRPRQPRRRATQPTPPRQGEQRRLRRYLLPHMLWAQRHGLQRPPGFLFIHTPSSDLDIDDTTLGKLLTEAHREYADYRSPEGVSHVQCSQQVFWKRPSWKKWSKARWNPWEKAAQTHRSLFDEQRKMIIPECCEKISHHEFQAVRAEEECRILQEELCQQKDFREVHQQDYTEMGEYRKFESFTFDTLTRQMLIEDEKTFLELCGRLHKLQHEVNCMSDSKDFQDAESVRSENSHVTSQPILFLKHPIPEKMLRHSFASPRRKEGLPNIGDTHGISGNVFANPPASSSAPYPKEFNPWKNHWKTDSYVYSGEKWKTRTKPRSEMPVWTVSQTFSHLQWGGL